MRINCIYPKFLEGNCGSKRSCYNHLQHKCAFLFCSVFCTAINPYWYNASLLRTSLHFQPLNINRMNAHSGYGSWKSSQKLRLPSQTCSVRSGHQSQSTFLFFCANDLKTSIKLGRRRTLFLSRCSCLAPPARSFPPANQAQGAADPRLCCPKAPVDACHRVHHL